MSVFDYTEKLIHEIQNQVKQCHFLDENIIAPLVAALKNNLDACATESGSPVAVVQTHGDFQPANILVAGNAAWLIDWEHTAPRQAAYDLLVLATGSRFAGFSDRIRHFLANGSREWDGLFKDCPFLAWQDAAMRKTSVVLFLLEELEMRLRQDANPLFQKPGEGFDIFLQDMRESFCALDAT